MANPNLQKLNFEGQTFSLEMKAVSTQFVLQNPPMVCEAEAKQRGLGAGLGGKCGRRHCYVCYGLGMGNRCPTPERWCCGVRNCANCTKAAAVQVKIPRVRSSNQQVCRNNTMSQYANPTVSTRQDKPSAVNMSGNMGGGRSAGYYPIPTQPAQTLTINVPGTGSPPSYTWNNRDSLSKDEAKWEVKTFNYSRRDSSVVAVNKQSAHKIAVNIALNLTGKTDAYPANNSAVSTVVNNAVSKAASNTQYSRGATFNNVKRTINIAPQPMPRVVEHWSERTGPVVERIELNPMSMDYKYIKYLLDGPHFQHFTIKKV